MKKTLYHRIFSYNLLLAIIILLIVAASSYFLLTKAVENEIGKHALSVAKITAKDPRIVDGLKKGRTTEEFRRVVLEIQEQAGAEYIVIGDTHSIRLAHPIKNRIGEKMVGNDNEKALIYGESYTSVAKGTMGEALRGKSPVKDENGKIIGIVSVGFLKEDIFFSNMVYTKYLIIILFITVMISILLAFFLANKVKKQLLNYEPGEIAEILTERNAMVESIREGIILVDTSGIITLSNQAANNIFQESLVGKNIQDIIPNTRLLEVMTKGEKQVDRVMYLNSVKTLVNGVPIFKDGQFFGAVSSFRPYEEIDVIADELSQVNHYIESLRAQTHEFNNFLYTISGLIQLKAYDEVVEIIHNEGIGNNALINFMSKHIKDTYLSGVIIGYYNRAKELKVNLLLDESSYCTKLEFPLEKHLLISILGNLMVNAYEAVEMLEESKRVVRLYIFEHDDEIVFEVEDSGEGIKADQIDMIFEKKQSTKAKGERGYGLYIVKENLIRLNGSISIETGDLGGALFIVSIPKEG